MRNLLLVLFVFAFATAQANNYYFSDISGNDSRTPVQAQSPLTPWKTITKLNSFFTSLLPGDSVLFKRGETFFGSIIVKRSGSLALPIVIAAYGSGAKPVITGFQTISSWTPIGGNISENTCSTCPPTLNMLTINDTLQPVGRWPKANDPQNGWKTINSHVGITSITSTDLNGAPNFVGGEVVIRKLGWILDRAIITSQNASTLSFVHIPYPHNPDSIYKTNNQYGFFIQNHPATLSRAGEWSYDKTTKKIKIYDRGSGVVKVPIIETLVDIQSYAYFDFHNISFVGSNSNLFKLEYAPFIKINNCDISFAGIDAIYGNSDLINDITLTNSTISFTNNNAITANESPNWIIKNNVIRNTGMIKGMGQSGDRQYVALSYIGKQSVMEYNVIKNTGYHGIFFGGDDILIKNNFIDSFSMSKSDGGGIYTNAETTKRNRVIKGNIILNGIGDRFGRGLEAAQNPFAGNVHGIYMDFGATHVQIDSNSVANCASSGMELSSSSNVQATNNTLFNNTFTQIIYFDYAHPVTNLTVKHNILFATEKEQLISLIFASSGMSTWGVIDSNYYCRPIKEPANIDTPGYSHQPLLTDYPDGGIIQAHDSRFYSLDKWQIFSSQDAHTKKTQAVNVDFTNVRFEYNATKVNKIIPLDGSYRDVKNNPYNNSVTLAPFTSIILLKSSVPIVLPLQFLYFDVYKAGTEAELKWSTANEVNTLLFGIERSSDGVNFTDLGNIPAKNIAGITNLYNYRDKRPVKGNNFYRLKQVDLNGTYSYSKIVRISFEEKVTFQISPNPVRNQMRIVLDKDQNAQNRYLSIQTLSGIKVKEIPVSSSSDVITVDMSRFPDATYIISLIDKDVMISKKIVKRSHN